jgi:hypothetical protein
MPICSARSFDLTLRFASMISRLTIIGMPVPQTI